ncbi:glycerophosphodiester phosphodiesterase family protein [Sanguibacter sp. HDW7]|uniref:glycerophosphoryl diester phosphodiesterase membrane domain-containing protein n=1 Tax=Sanguibacter sp. HDW7 TaxID=2714931 RepID=UPI00140DBC77|nr:glycerophosphodiester phosphodiesterase family protein [Sanguibacter sp. HDW7]QIK82677.1 hypothetical protein G7063_02855 [Sanguibacter sp. HDW7]
MTIEPSDSSPTPSGRARPGADLRRTVSLLRSAGPRWVLVAAAVGAAGLVVVPLVGLLLALAVSAAGLPALTHLDLGTLLTTPASVALVALGIVLVAVTVLVQQGVLVRLVADALAGRPARLRDAVGGLRGPVRRLLGPGALLLLLYAMVLVPLGAVGVGAALARDVDVPEFITGELLRNDGGWVLLAVTVALVTWVDLRLALTVPTLVLTGRGVGASLAASWRATRRTWWRIGLTLGAVGLTVSALAALVAATVLVPTRLADAYAPAIATVVAGTSLALTSCVGVLLAAVATTATATVTTAGTLASVPGAADDVPDAPVTGAATADGDPAGAAPAGRRSDRVSGRRAVVVAVVAVVGLSAAGTAAVAAVTEPRASLVAAHRGEYSRAVENTIEALEAAAAAGADLVELDVLQTADGGLVVFHDLTLRRLAGDGRAIATTTAAELEDVLLRQAGSTGRIPTFEAFVQRAAELDVDLLVELKAHGDETPSYVPDVLEVLRTAGAGREVWVQSIYPGLADEVERLAPEIRTGYVVAFARGVRARPPVDFVALEQSSATPSVRARARAAGLDVLVWTVERPEAMRSLFRAGVDGIITGDAPTAARIRDEVAAEDGVAPRLEELVRQQLRR